MQPFDEQQHSEAAAVDFDFDAVAEALGEPEERGCVLREQRQAELNLCLCKILDWLTAVPLGDWRSTRRIGMRTIAMAWVISPERFEGSSLATVAKKLGCTPANISPLTAEFSRLFGVRNKYQDHNWRKDKHVELTGVAEAAGGEAQQGVTP